MKRLGKPAPPTAVETRMTPAERSPRTQAVAGKRWGAGPGRTPRHASGRVRRLGEVGHADAGGLGDGGVSGTGPHDDKVARVVGGGVGGCGGVEVAAGAVVGGEGLDGDWDAGAGVWC